MEKSTYPSTKSPYSAQEEGQPSGPRPFASAAPKTHHAVDRVAAEVLLDGNGRVDLDRRADGLLVALHQRPKTPRPTKTSSKRTFSSRRASPFDWELTQDLSSAPLRSAQ